MKINVLTAVSRIGNMNTVGHSIMVACAMADDVRVEWHKRFDFNRDYVGGQHLKNEMLAEITDGWVCILDDDTEMHPSFLRKVYRANKRHPDANAIVVSQKRTNGTVLQAKRENMQVGMVDAGQVVMRRSFIGDVMIPETYAGDGEWIEFLMFQRKDVVFLPDVLSLHNALSGIDVSETPERMGA